MIYDDVVLCSLSEGICLTRFLFSNFIFHSTSLVAVLVPCTRRWKTIHWICVYSHGHKWPETISHLVVHLMDSITNPCWATIIIAAQRSLCLPTQVVLHNCRSVHLHWTISELACLMYTLYSVHSVHWELAFCLASVACISRLTFGLISVA